MKLKYSFYPVVLAGGSGTRFWPRSRRRMAKQVLALDGEQTMIQQTVLRLLPLASEDRFWIITNEHIIEAISGQLKRVPQKQIISEPVARNTAPAIGLAAFGQRTFHEIWRWRAALAALVVVLGVAGLLISAPSP